MKAYKVRHDLKWEKIATYVAIIANPWREDKHRLEPDDLYNKMSDVDFISSDSQKTKEDHQQEYDDIVEEMGPDAHEVQVVGDD